MSEALHDSARLNSQPLQFLKYDLPLDVEPCLWNRGDTDSAGLICHQKALPAGVENHKRKTENRKFLPLSSGDGLCYND